MTKIDLTNDFHGTKHTLHVSETAEYIFVSRRQAERSRKALCGVSGCKCGGALGERGKQKRPLTPYSKRLPSWVTYSDGEGMYLEDAGSDD